LKLEFKFESKEKGTKNKKGKNNKKKNEWGA
jgi:hypothetical protein